MANINPVQVKKFLGGVDYPCSKQDLLTTAERQGADQSVMKTIQNLPRDQFNSPNDVSEAMGGMNS